MMTWQTALGFVRIIIRLLLSWTDARKYYQLNFELLVICFKKLSVRRGGDSFHNSRASRKQKGVNNDSPIIMAIPEVIKASPSAAAVPCEKFKVPSSLVTYNKTKGFRYCVTFDESRNVQHETEPWTSPREDCRRRWYTNAEYRKMKESSQALAKHLTIKDATQERLPQLEDLSSCSDHRTNVKSSSSYHAVVLRVYDKCCQAPSNFSSNQNAAEKMRRMLISDHDEVLLANVVRKHHSRAGLEKIIIRDIAHDKRYRRSEVTKRVLAVQANHGPAASASARRMLTRRASESVSQTSRLFAHCMAMALQSALRVQREMEQQ